MPVRKIPIKTGSVSGRHAMKHGGRAIGFESTLERDFITLMAFDTSVVDIEEQPVRINYVADGKRRHYTPDFLITRKDESVQLVEVKPSDVLEREAEILAVKFSAAENYAAEQSWRFNVVTEQDIRIPRLENAKFLLSYRDVSSDPGLCARIITHVRDHPSDSIHTVLEACWSDEWEQSRGLRALWHLVAIRRLITDLDSALTTETALRLNEGELP